MAVFRTKAPDAIELERKLFNNDPAPAERVADFSYQSDALAEMIVFAWTNDEFKDRLLNPRNARDLLADRGIYLSKPIVITEDAYRRGHHSDDPDEVVFVLPNKPRITNPAQGHSLLETAKLLMACTPNGI